ncbi:MAG TPA: hypothetical protein VFN35_18555 [Ktedonobacteraceae bacterium]|nr:hypothetical protein [Ktedonobacteraceae bacterium]
MNSIADGSVIVQTFADSRPCPPQWWGELVLLSQHLRKQGILTRLTEGIRFERRRFGHYELIDFLVVLFGYAVSSEHTLKRFYEAVEPWAHPFMALFGRDRLPSRSALSRALAALTAPVLETLRTLFLADLLARPLDTNAEGAGLWDRQGQHWRVFDIDGTREAARLREQTPYQNRSVASTPCAPGYTGRKRGEVVRTRTTVLQAHSHQWLGSFGNKGNGLYRQELRQVVEVISAYLTAHQFSSRQALLRLDGAYGTGAVLADLAGYTFVTRGKDYMVLDHPLVQARLHLPPDGQQRRPESQMTRSLYDCPNVPVGPEGVRCRVVVATHPASKTKRRIGIERARVVYELFFTNLPQQSFTVVDVVELYLHRGAFEPTLSDEDDELDPDRWCSHAACGQECWQLIAQWIWNLRLELGHVLTPQSIRTTEFAPALSLDAADRMGAGYREPASATSWKADRFTGSDFALQPDGSLRCPVGKSLLCGERRPEADGSLRLVYEARIADCRACSLRQQCQWHGHQAKHPRRVSLLLHPRQVGSAPLLWRDWSRRSHRRACIQLLRHQRIEVHLPPVKAELAPPPKACLSRAQRAHYRLPINERLAGNARAADQPPPTFTLFGVPDHFALFLGLQAA